MNSNNLIAIYDFEFFPYALGDVLTWNIRTAIRCDETAKKAVDIYICLDKNHSASIYQRGLINPDNYELFFNELYSAFGTHPKLGNIYIFRQRQRLIEILEEITNKTDSDNQEAIDDYFNMLNQNNHSHTARKIYNKIEKKIQTNSLLKKIIPRVLPRKFQNSLRNNLSDEKKLNDYFIKYIYSHEKINQFAKQKGYIPFLQESLGCSPDIDELLAQRFEAKKIVTFHLRLRRLDVGYGGDHTYSRDSDFLEWYDFLRTAADVYPQVQFIVLGRLQEKPLEILKLPNVMSLRVFGLGLGHELTLMLKSDLFIGTSSGFAALANFSALPYFITRMNPGSCKAYAIPEGAAKLPFAQDNQHLIYEQETSTLLMNLLEKGLELKSSNGCQNPTASFTRDDWKKLQAQPKHPARTTSRFYQHEKYTAAETTYLLLPYLNQAQQAIENQEYHKANVILLKLQENFPAICEQLPEYLALQEKIPL